MDEIIEQLIDKMDKTSYDDTVILGTLLILLESNKDAYKNVIKGGEKIEITEDTDIFADIASDMLNKIFVDKTFKFKDFTANYNNLQQRSILNDSIDPEETQTNFEQNFVNLAQVFYEMQFCGDKLETSNTNIQNIMVIVENMLLTKDKSLQVTYYNNKRLSNDDRIKQEEFANIANVDFGRAATLRDLKKKVSVPTESKIKHQIVVLDDPAIGVDKIQELVDLCNIYTVFILVNIPGFENENDEKEIVRVVSIMSSNSSFIAPPQGKNLIKGGVRGANHKKGAKPVVTCSDVDRVIKDKSLAIGRHITNKNFSLLLNKLKEKNKANVTENTLTGCLDDLGYSVVNDQQCIKVLSSLSTLFKNNPSSKDMITHEQFENLASTVSREELLQCLPKLGYNFQSSMDCAKVDTFIKNSQEYLDEDFKYAINNLKGLKTKGKTQNPQIEETTIDKCIPQLGYSYDKSEEDDISRTVVDTKQPERQPSSDPNVDTSQSKGIDCEGVKTLMQENVDKLDFGNSANYVNILAPLGQNKTPPISKETIEKCLTSLDDKIEEPNTSGPVAVESSTKTVSNTPADASDVETNKPSTGVPTGAKSSFPGFSSFGTSPPPTSTAVPVAAESSTGTVSITPANASDVETNKSSTGVPTGAKSSFPGFSSFGAPPDDCETVLQEIQKNNYAVGKLITMDNYMNLLRTIKDETKLNECLTSLGFEVDIPKSSTTGPVTSSDPTKPKSDLSLGDSEDCAKVKEEIEKKGMAKGMYIFTSDYYELSQTVELDEEQLDECLENLGFKVAVNEDDDDIHESLKSLKKKYNMPEDSLVLTRDQYNELLDIFFNSFEPPENYKTRVYNTLTYFLGYTIKEPDTGGPATATQPAKSSTTGPVTSSDPTKPKSDLSFPAGTPPAGTPSAGTPSAATPPDPLKNKLGMYHGCSYKGYEFRADIDLNLYDTKVFYEDEKDLDTIVRYFIFSNIVVFIVN